MKKMAWGFLGGYLLFFMGWMAGFIAAITFVNAHEAVDPASQVTHGYALTIAAVALFVAGAQIVVRAHCGGMSAHPEALVIFLMTPLPAFAAVILNSIGGYFRRSDGTILRPVLVVGGVYLTATTGMALENGLP